MEFDNGEKTADWSLKELARQHEESHIIPSFWDRVGKANRAVNPRNLDANTELLGERRRTERSTGIAVVQCEEFALHYGKDA